MKDFFLVMLFLVSCNIVYSQNKEDSSIARDTIKDELDRYDEVFLGIWVAIQGDDIYELKLEKRVIYYAEVEKCAIIVVGAIRKIHNNRVIYYRAIRDTNVISDDAFPLFGGLISPDVLCLFYRESGEKTGLGNMKFTLNADKQTATWELSGMGNFKLEGYDRFEIPYKMIFKRKQVKNP